MVRNLFQENWSKNVKKETGEYLEFEIYEDRIEFFSISQKGEEQEETFLGKSAAERMKQMVVDFYG